MPSPSAVQTPPPTLRRRSTVFSKRKHRGSDSCGPNSHGGRTDEGGGEFGGRGRQVRFKPSPGSQFNRPTTSFRTSGAGESEAARLVAALFARRAVRDARVAEWRRASESAAKRANAKRQYTSTSAIKWGFFPARRAFPTFGDPRTARLGRSLAGTAA
jgi:hypothetical protein